MVSAQVKVVRSKGSITGGDFKNLNFKKETEHVSKFLRIGSQNP
jgi:hypothetical protein